MSELVNTFRELHQGPQVLCLANAWDAGSARLAQSLGARAVATTSAGLAWSLGYADGGGMPADAAIAAAKNIARVLSVPLTVDVEDGYSQDPAGVAGHVMQLLGIGVVGINIEDGADAPDLLAAKIEAVKNAVAKTGGDIFVNVRTDVYLRGLASDGAQVKEVLARGELYRSAGADGLFVPGICLADEIQQVAKGAGLPLNVMDWPALPSLVQLRVLGVRRLSAGTSIAQTIWGVARDAMKGFFAAGDAGAAAYPPMDYGEIQQLFLSN